MATNNTAVKSSNSGTGTSSNGPRASSSSSPVSTKAVHPANLTAFAPTGVELSTWAYLTQARSTSGTIPNLVTAHANSLKLYVIDPKNGKLLLASSYDNLAGIVVSLHTLSSAAGTSSAVFDGLLVGFAGHPRLSIVYPPLCPVLHHNNTQTTATVQWNGVLAASSIIDLTSPLTDRCWGSVTPLEQDLICAVSAEKKNSRNSSVVPTAAVILGGGVAVATFQLPRAPRGEGVWWRNASEPYLLPLHSLSSYFDTGQSSPSSTIARSSVKHSKLANSNPQQQVTAGTNEKKISHSFGEILALTFLPTYTEPTIVLLHSNPHRNGGRAWSGRLAHTSSGTRHPLSLTAVSLSIPMKRSVVLWSARDSIPSDAFHLEAISGGVLVVGVNEILLVEINGRISCGISVNGWVRSTCPASVPLRPNPSPLPKLSIQLDACQLTVIYDSVAILCLRDGSFYSLEIHKRKTKTMSLSPLGYKLGALGMISTLTCLPLIDDMQTFVNSVNKDEDKIAKKEDDSLLDEDNELMKKVNSASTSVGLLFAGSRLGDSSLLLYGTKGRVALMSLKDETTRKRKRHEDDSVTMKREQEDDSDNSPLLESTENEGETTTENGMLAREEILRLEEEQLYGPPDEAGPNLIPPSSSDDDDDENSMTDLISISNCRSRITCMTMFHPTKALDSLTGLGPIGPGCVGPTATILISPPDTPMAPGTTAIVAGGGSTTNIHPCGYGSSGGLAILTAPGLDYGSTIVSEVDCRNLSSIFACKELGYIFLIKEESIGEEDGGVNGGGCIILKLQRSANTATSGVKGEPTDNSEECQLMEVDVSHWTSSPPSAGDRGVANMELDFPSPFDTAKDVFHRTTIVSVKEWSVSLYSSPFVVVLIQYRMEYRIVILSEISGNDGTAELRVNHVYRIGDENTAIRGSLSSMTPMETIMKGRGASEDILSFACVWSTGCGSVFTITCHISSSNNTGDWIITEATVVGENNDFDMQNSDNGDMNPFYSKSRIVAMDVFTMPEDVFCHSSEKKPKDATPLTTVQTKSDAADDDYGFDADDLELYDDETLGTSLSRSENSAPTASNGSPLVSTNLFPTLYNTLGGYISGASLSENIRMYVAVCRQSGLIQILDVSILNSVDAGIGSLAQELSSDEKTAKAVVWQAVGCASGISLLSPVSSTEEGLGVSLTCQPKMHDVRASEIRFFFSGPSETGPGNAGGDGSDLSILRSLCIMIETSLGDLYLYTGSKSNSGNVEFRRVSMGIIARPSKEEGKHITKLKRKGIISTIPVVTSTNSHPDGIFAKFRPNRLHRFVSISSQDGLFAATSRPVWVVSERGAPSILCHRMRHVAPAGGRQLPMTGFCAGIRLYGTNDVESGYLALHERIGRVGSQRLTLFNGLSDIFTPYGLLAGGGLSVQKVPLGVTVRQIQFIDNASVSSAAHPLYAVLISREILVDQSHLNDDGLTPEERQRAKSEKEAAKTRRQVEADLGGFDVEQEWVEEIERDDCFEIEKAYGGAPPIANRVYEVWLVDATGWSVVDTYPLQEFEHGMTMKVMHLSNISEDANSGPMGEIQSGLDDSSNSVIFITVGTGIVDKDGEDIGSKGRVILLEVKMSPDLSSPEMFSPDLSFVYDKDILLGPVTSLNCLSCNNKHRLVVGAGAEITVEQWGNKKLTQVGFFHANMQVQDIVLFKSFLLLSDAYDSLHFLVWRESDKSLTLLAKDYEPNPVYASGLLSRGGSVSFVCHDDRQNLQFFQYAPNDAAARGGNKLVCRADYHLGAQTVGLQSHYCRSSLLINSATAASTLAALKQQDAFFGKLDDDQRFALHFGTTSGGFGSVVPLSEQVYWRLAALQSVMSNALESNCALSFRAWRLYRRTPRRGGCRSNDRKKGVIDGDLVIKYADLSLTEQEDLASAIGSTVELILDNLLEVSCASMVI